MSENHNSQNPTTLPPAPGPVPKEPLKPGKDWPAKNSTTPHWSDWDAESRGFDCAPGCGLTISVASAPQAISNQWLCWEETVAFHEWLGRKIFEAKRAMALTEIARDQQEIGKW